MKITQVRANFYFEFLGFSSVFEYLSSYRYVLFFGLFHKIITEKRVLVLALVNTAGFKGTYNNVF